MNKLYFIFILIGSSMCGAKYSLNMDEINSVFYRIDIQNIPVLKTKDFSSETLLVTNKYKQEYLCTLPPALEIVSGLKKEEENQEQLVDVSELLKPMEDAPCLLKTMSWWSYELCHRSVIKQYHLEDDKVVGKIIILGKYESEYEWTKNSKSKNKLQKFHTQKYVNGTKCDITEEPRQVEVRFHCEEGVGDYIQSVDEPESCKYVFTVATTRVCHHPYLKPTLNQVPHNINCSPALSQSQMELYNVRQSKKEKTKTTDEADDIKFEIHQVSPKKKTRLVFNDPMDEISLDGTVKTEVHNPHFGRNEKSQGDVNSRDSSTTNNVEENDLSSNNLEENDVSPKMTEMIANEMKRNDLSSTVTKEKLQKLDYKAATKLLAEDQEKFDQHVEILERIFDKFVENVNSGDLQIVETRELLRDVHRQIRPVLSFLLAEFYDLNLLLKDGRTTVNNYMHDYFTVVRDGWDKLKFNTFTEIFWVEMKDQLPYYLNKWAKMTYFPNHVEAIRVLVDFATTLDMMKNMFVGLDGMSANESDELVHKMVLKMSKILKTSDGNIEKYLDLFGLKNANVPKKSLTPPPTTPKPDYRDIFGLKKPVLKEKMKLINDVFDKFFENFEDGEDDDLQLKEFEDKIKETLKDKGIGNLGRKIEVRILTPKYLEKSSPLSQLNADETQKFQDVIIEFLTANAEQIKEKEHLANLEENYHFVMNPEERGDFDSERSASKAKIFDNAENENNIAGSDNVIEPPPVF